MIDHPYSRLMEEVGASVVLKLDLSDPVEIRDFTATFASLSGQFERFIREEHPDLEGEVKVYVKEVRKGSIEAIMFIASAYPSIVQTIDHAQIVTTFTKSVARRVKAFMKPGGRLPGAGKSELNDIVGTVVAAANDPDGRVSIKALNYRANGQEVDFSLEFSSDDARFAMNEIQGQYKELEKVSDFDHENKLLTFFQSNRKDSDKTGEKGIIEDISPKPLAVVYASDLARARIKGEMLSGDRNIYKLGFFVDVNVQTKSGKPVAYRIKQVRDVIELPDDD